MPDLSSDLKGSNSSSCSGDGGHFAVMSHGPISTADGRGYGAAILGRLVDFNPNHEDGISATTSPSPDAPNTWLKLEHLCRVNIDIAPVSVPGPRTGSDTKSDSLPILPSSGMAKREAEHSHGHEHGYAESESRKSSGRSRWGLGGQGTGLVCPLAYLRGTYVVMFDRLYVLLLLSHGFQLAPQHQRVYKSCNIPSSWFNSMSFFHHTEMTSKSRNRLAVTDNAKGGLRT